MKTRRDFLKSTALGALTTILPASLLCSKKKRPKPNVIVILADDMGYGDVKALNPDSRIPTPNLDRLAGQAVRFTDAHSGSAVCTPTRYGIVTGRYCFRSRLKSGVLWGYDKPLIEPERLTLGSLMQKNGYRTGVIGKWHLGLGWELKDPNLPIVPPQIGESSIEVKWHLGKTWKKYDEYWPMVAGQIRNKEGTSNVNYSKRVSGGPDELGFDYSFVFPASLDMAPYCYVRNGEVVDDEIVFYKGLYKNRGIIARHGEKSKSLIVENVLEDLTEESMNFIKRNAYREDGKPFFLYFPMTAPHTPWTLKDEYIGKSEAGQYGDFVHMTDAMIGRLVSTLEEEGILENTLIIFTSDNGAHWEPIEIKQYGHLANYNRRGMKSDIWDGGHHIPFIVHWPEQIKEAADCDNLVCTTDFMGTFADLLEYDLAENEGEDSFSFLSYINPELSSRETRRDIIHHGTYGDFSIRTPEWKYIDCNTSGGWSLEADEVDSNAPPAQLYNMGSDIGEKANLIDEKPDIAKQLKTRLKQQVAARGTRQ
jgi:arylsulfatase A